jgi:hypothetical protein
MESTPLSYAELVARINAFSVLRAFFSHTKPDGYEEIDGPAVVKVIDYRPFWAFPENVV